MFKLFKEGIVLGAGYWLGVGAVTAITVFICEYTGLGNKNEASKEEAQD